MKHIIDINDKIIKKKIFIDLYNCEDELITVFTKDGRANREDIDVDTPASYHINAAKVFEKYYIDKKN